MASVSATRDEIGPLPRVSPRQPHLVICICKTPGEAQTLAARMRAEGRTVMQWKHTRARLRPASRTPAQVTKPQ
jgi:hypothetical protein